MLLSSRVWKQVDIKGSRIYNIMLPVRPDGVEERNSTGAKKISEDPEYKRIVEYARQEAARQGEIILQESRKEAEKVREVAQREGFDAGYRNGLKEGEAAAKDLRQEAEEILEEARRRRDEIIATAEPEVVRLALEMAAKILHRRLKENPGSVVDLVVRALQEVPYGKSVLLRVHPEDEPVCRQAESRFYQYLRGTAELEIIEDHEMPRGGCCVETTDGRIEVLPEQEMNRLREELLALATNPKIS